MLFSTRFLLAGNVVIGTTRIPFCGVIDLIIQTTTTKKCVCKKTHTMLRIESKEEAKRKSKQQQCHGPPMDLTEQQQTAKCIYR